MDKYRLTVGSYIKGNAGDSLSTHNNMKFSTKDQDHDIWSSSCVQRHNGAWWYQTCQSSNLNGDYLRSPHPTVDVRGVNWDSFKGYYYSLKRSEMKKRKFLIVTNWTNKSLVFCYFVKYSW
jgi:ficolin